VDFTAITSKQARVMLNRVHELVREHRRTPEFHYSEQNPAYLKLVMMEQVLSARVKEDAMGGATVGLGQPSGGTIANTATGAGPAANTANMAMQMAAKKKQSREQAADIDKQIQALQQQKSQLLQQANSPMGESRLQRRLREASEIQQAQVVLASQDMVDQVQKMIEQVTSMQFKDLPALIDQIKNEVGVDQAGQFNNDANAALGGLVQNLQASKQQLEQALGVVTGQAPTIPGQDLSAEPAPDLGAEVPPEGGENVDINTDIEEPELPAGGSVNDLGRTRR
jgi:hypothetical protein